MMNNADFLSDAVALDLGKSGVKVAETLEIQVGEEWWRLINAAAGTDAKLYQGRRANEGAVSGGEIHLGEFTRAGLQMSAGWDASYASFQRMHAVKVGETVYYYGVSNNQANNTPYFRVWTDSAELSNTALAGNLTLERLKGSYYDSVNGRIVGGYSDRGVYFSIAAGTSTLFYSVAVKSSDLWTIETFPEAPGSIYSFFLSSAGGAKVKITTPTAGQNVTTQFNAVISNSGATVLTAITNFSLAHGLHPFYLRSAESVAVAWIDATSGQIGYVLESESWATARYFPAISGMLTQSVLGMGAAMLPLDGEFVMVATYGYTTGNVGKTAGYSFPANFALLGGYPLGDGIMRVFGYVGNTVYAYNLNTTTMSMEYIGVTTSAWTYGGVEPVKVAESGDLDLLVFSKSTKTSVQSSYPPHGLALYNRETNAFSWLWHDFTNTTLFPASGQYYPNAGSVFRFDESLLFIKTYTSPTTSYRMESIVVPVASVIACADAAAVTALLAAAGCVRGITTGTNVQESYTAPGYNGSLAALMHDDSFLYLIHSEKSLYPPAGRLHLIRILKSDRTQCSLLMRNLNGQEYAMSGTRVVAAALQKRNGTYLYKSAMADGQDNLFRVSVLNTSNNWMLAFWDPVSAPTSPRNTNVTIGGNSYATTILFPAVEELGEMASFTSYGTTMRQFGASWDLNTRSGFDSKQWTAPFAPVFALASDTDDVSVFFGAVSGGELPYIRHRGQQGLTSGLWGIRVSDSEVFELNLGHTCAGGLNHFSPCGSWIVYRAMSGVTRMVDTGASLTDGMGGGVGGGSAVGLYVYDYLDRQFVPYPFAREGIRAELSNISKTTKITLPETQDNLIRGMLAAGTDFRGSRCILRRVFPDHIDEPGSDIVLLDGYIQDWSYVPGKKGIAFSVSKTLIDVGAQFPKRLMNMGCSHVFKGSRCRYLGEEGRCLKTRAFCTSLGNLNQFGGFPWVAARQRRVMWK